MAELPNLLTISRIAMIPVLVALFYVEADWAAWTAGAVFLLAGITDYLDGWLARRLGVVSVFGRLMDPIADKMLVAAALLMLVGFGRVTGVAIVAAVVILLREVLISGLREFLAGAGAPGLPVGALAKWKTGVQMAAIGLLIVAPAVGAAAGTVATVALWLAAALTLITGWEYLRAGWAQIGRASP